MTKALLILFCVLGGRLAALPPTPAGLTATATGVSGTVQLAWLPVTSVPNLSGYKVYYGLVSDVAYATPLFLTTTGTTLTTLANWQPWWFFVAAVDTVDGEGLTGTPVTATPYQVPDAPGLLLNGGSEDGRRVNLAWTLGNYYASQPGGVRVERLESNGAGTLLASYGPGVSAVALTLPCGQSLTLQARARNVHGYVSAPSVPVMARIPCAPNFAPLFLNNGRLAFTWSLADVGTQAVQWEVRWATGPGLASSTLEGITPGTATGMSVTAAPPQDTERWYRLRVLDAGGLTSPVSVEIPLLAPPSDLKIVTGTTSAYLSWTRPAVDNPQGVTQWHVYYATYSPPVRGAAGTTEVTFTAAAASAQAVTVSPLVPGQKYYFSVAAAGGFGTLQRGPQSPPVAATAGLEAPAFSIVRSTDPATLEFAWVAAPVGKPFTATYQLMSAPASDLSGATPVGPPLTVTTLAGVARPPADTWYFVHVSSSSGASSPWTPSTQVLYLGALSAPSATVGTTSNARVALRWGAVPNASSYQVFRSTGTGYMALADGLVNGLEYIDASPRNGVWNGYRVQARMASGVGTGVVLSDYSAPVGVTPEVKPGPPGRYGNVLFGAPSPAPPAYGDELSYLTVVARSDGSVYLLWTPAEAGSYPISRYRIWRGWSADTLLPLTWIGADNPSYTDSAPPAPREALVYAVEAEDSRPGGALFSRRVSGTVGNLLRWPPPVTLTAKVLGGSVTLAWASPSGMGSYAFQDYQVSRRWSGAASWVLLTRTTKLTWTDLAVDTTQGSHPEYGVAVRDMDGGVGIPLVVSATLPPAPPVGGTPAAPAWLSATVLAQTGLPVQLRWEPLPEAQGVFSHVIYRDGSFLAETGTTTLVDSSVSVGTSYIFQVQAKNAAGVGPTTTAAVLTVVAPQPAWVSLSAAVDLTREGLSLSARLSWEDLGVGVAPGGYEVYAAPGGFVNLTLASLVAATGSATVELNAVTPSAYMAYAVISLNGPHWPSAAVAQLSLTLPAAPSTLTGLSVVPQSGGAQLSWNQDAAAQEYWIFRSTAAFTDEPPVVARIARTGALAWSDSTAGTGQVQHYAVCAVNSLGRGPAAQQSVLPLAGKPKNLQAAAGYNGSARIELSWSAPDLPATATAYRIWRASAPDAYAPLATTTASTYSDPVPLTNTAYWYGVSAWDLGEGPLATIGPLRAYNPPSPPALLSAVGVPGAVDLAWTPATSVEGVTGYALSLEIDGVPSVLTMAANASFYRVGSLAAGTAVSASVQALNSAGASAWSVTAVAYANAVGPPARPSTFTAAVGYAEAVSSLARVVLSWSAPGAGAVVLYRSIGPMPLSLAAGGPDSPLWLTTLAASLNSLSDTSVTEGQPYAYAITAVGAEGLPGAESAPLVLPPQVPYRDAHPVGLSAVAGSGRVDLQWSQADPSTATYGLAPRPYRLHRKKTAIAPATLAAILGNEDPGFPLDLSGTSYVDTAVENGSTYFYFLGLVDGAGHESREGAFPRLNGSSSAAPQKPQGPRRPPSTIEVLEGNASVTLRWFVPSGESYVGARYNVYRRLPGQAVATLVMDRVGPDYNASVLGSLASVRDASGLLNKTLYYYSISAVNAWGEGPRSSEVAAVPHQPLLDPQLPGSAAVVASLTLAVQNKKDVVLNWLGTPDADPMQGYALAAYRVYRSQDGGGTYTLLTTVAATVLSYTDTDTQFGGAYTYRLVPVDTAGYEGYPYRLVKAVIPEAVNAVLLFRNAFNPAQGELLPVQFAIQSPGRVWVRVFTLNGEYVTTLFDEEVPDASEANPYLSERRTWNGQNADGRLVASGVYLVHMEGPGFRSNARVAVIK